MKKRTKFLIALGGIGLLWVLALEAATYYYEKTYDK